MKPYPSRDGVPVPTEEVGLALSRLNPNNEKNYNNHHLYFCKSTYQGDFILNGLRNLERSQELMLRDQHNLGKTALHAMYGPPERPTHRQAMEQIDQAFYNDEKLKIWSPKLGQYALREISPLYWGQLREQYTKLKG